MVNLNPALKMLGQSGGTPAGRTPAGATPPPLPCPVKDMNGILTRKYMIKLVSWRYRQEGLGKRTPWDSQKKRPDFYPDFLPWTDPYRRPTNIPVHEWIPLLKKGIGRLGYPTEFLLSS